MKKFKTLLFITILTGFATLSMNAQEISKNALGLRLGDNDGLGAEVSYQRHLSGNNRLEFDLGWRDSNNVDVVKLVGLYQWVMNLDGNFNWYVGAGAGFLTFDAGEFDGSTFLAAGDIGIEYNFDIPLLLSLDFRPELAFDDDFRDDLGFDIALGIRYQF